MADSDAGEFRCNKSIQFTKNYFVWLFLDRRCFLIGFLDWLETFNAELPDSIKEAKSVRNTQKEILWLISASVFELNLILETMRMEPTTSLCRRN